MKQYHTYECMCVYEIERVCMSTVYYVMQNINSLDLPAVILQANSAYRLEDMLCFEHRDVSHTQKNLDFQLHFGKSGNSGHLHTAAVGLIRAGAVEFRCSTHTQVFCDLLSLLLHSSLLLPFA